MKGKKEVILLSCLGVMNSKFVVETIEAGAFPILRLECGVEKIKDEIATLSKRINKPFGVCIDVVIPCNLHLPSNVTKLIVPFGSCVEKTKNVEVLYQVHSLEEGEEAIKGEASSIILKGYEGTGKVAAESTFVLFRKLIKQASKHKTKVYIQGGGGIHTSAAFLALGADGVIFDSQIALFPGCIVPDSQVGAQPKQEKEIPAGKEAQLSTDFVERYKNLEQFIISVFEAVYGHLRQAKKLNVIGRDNDFAKEMGIPYPVVQIASEGNLKTLGFVHETTDVKEAALLEKEGIMAFVRSTSVDSLDTFLKEGAKNIIFEGNVKNSEGNSVFSIVPWESQINRILQKDKNLSKIHILFSGDICDAFSAAFVSIMAATLAAKGIKVGILQEKCSVSATDKLCTALAVDSNKLIAKIKDISLNNYSTRPLDIAIVGMECILPQARNKAEFWKNILLGKDCVDEVSDSRWSKELFYDPDTNDTDYCSSKWGGFIPTVNFDPVEFGLMPQSLSAIEPVQLLSLLVSKRAMEDAGYKDYSEMEDASVIFGANGLSELATIYSHRLGIRQLLGKLPDHLDAMLPKMNETSFSGILPNVISGRIANRLNFGGRNFTVDAACASSLVALDLACQELSSRRSNLVLIGGADLHNGIKDFLMFSSTFALSKKGRCAAFDTGADGIVLGEGMAALVLKRLEDAERDGNKIYAVVKGIGGSSDGRNFGVTAPSRKGETRALKRAYKNTGILPSQVGMIEAHGTGTVVGDKVELASLTDLFIESGAIPGQTYLGSVKTQIGHTKCTAGVAGMIKAILSVKHGVIPPTLHLKNINKFHDRQTSPFVFNTQAGIWNDDKRIAAVSAFGFGGTNFHAIIENYQAEVPESPVYESWPAEIFVFRGDTMDEAKNQMLKVKQLIVLHNELKPADLAYSLSVYNTKNIQVSIVSSSIEELSEKIDFAIMDKRDLRIFPRDVKEGKTVFLFSGQGSQRLNMARDLFVAFPSMRRLLNEHKEYAKILFPEAAFDEDVVALQESAITNTLNAQPVLGIVDFSIAAFLRSLGIEPDMVAGHSYGELPALCFAGAFASEHLVVLSRQRAESILQTTKTDKGKMLAVILQNNDINVIDDLLKDESEVWIVNYNSQKQITLAGSSSAIDAFAKKLSGIKIFSKELSVSGAFHSPLVAESEALFSKALKNVPFNTPHIPVWLNTTADIYPAEPEKIKGCMAKQLVHPVFFMKQIENMYEAGARVFIETGPGRVLAGLVDETLGKKVITIQTENKNSEGIAYFLRALAQYLSTGRNIYWEKMFEGRNVSLINIDEPEQYQIKSTTWFIDGYESKPFASNKINPVKNRQSFDMQEQIV
ncbi:MAG: acyltransferase domain-containing protein [Candidatus Symbiothrix sp.]|jgi:acyl transferase domain-containing protein|nr:acyltransferase domain-containing protein [Candidatus Symbiothrix sp.]